MKDINAANVISISVLCLNALEASVSISFLIEIWIVLPGLFCSGVYFVPKTTL